MNNEGRSYDELKKELLDRMVSRGCAQVTNTGYRYLCNSIINQMKSQGNQCYTKGSGNKVLEGYLKTNGNNQYYENLRTVVNRLNDLMDGTWSEIHSSRGIKFNLMDQQKIIVDNYCKHCGMLGRTDGTIKLKQYATQLFFSKLNEVDCTDIKRISAENISKACVRITDHNIW